MFTLSASDHRTGAYGDGITAQVETIEAAHAMAAELNCGLYSIDDVLYESDGTDYWTFYAADDNGHYHEGAYWEPACFCGLPTTNPFN